jgi:nitrate reductase NapE component
MTDQIWAGLAVAAVFALGFCCGCVWMYRLCKTALDKALAQ